MVRINNTDYDLDSLLQRHSANSVEAARELRAATGVTLKEAMQILKNYEKGILPKQNQVAKKTENVSNLSNQLQKEKLKSMPKVILYCALMLVIWPVGAFLIWKDKQIDKQLKAIEMFCCLCLWLLLAGSAVRMMHTASEKNSAETISTEKITKNNEDGVLTNKQTATPETNSEESVSEENTLVKIEAKYKGVTKAGTVLDDDNSGITVTGIYSDGTTEEIYENEFEIKKPVTLKAGKTSTVTITYNGKKYDLKVKCTTKKKQKKKHRKGKNIIGISNKDIHDIDGTFQADKVRNDVTGNWRISTIAANVRMEKYAMSYYKWVFLGDEEIHGIVNFTNKTTTKISVAGNILDVAVYEYVTGEEHDAKKLFSGMLLNEYFVYKDNGDIEKVQ